ncbi:hypothetical protein [Limosilactobacillus fermentum]|uniref:hypothetical protein n=1 Tax=Limosilactobacillus fermentum TaxID=1613 RepID=UPI0003075151|nr:hypothetical protein [Limosilactobacillus fermentum]
MENEESKDEVKTVSADSINGDAELFKKSLKENNYSVSFYFEYSKNGMNNMENFAYANATLDDDTSKSMLQRFIYTFKESKVNKNQIQKFDILKNNRDTIYYLNKNERANSKSLVKKLEDDNFVPSEDLTVLGNLENVKGAIAKVCIGTNSPYYLFMKVDNFNAFKKKRLSSGFMGNLTNDGVEKLDDNHLYFGIKNNISFYYSQGVYIINTHSDFEKMLFLSSEYDAVAKDNIKHLKTDFSNVFKNIDEIDKGLEGKSSSIFTRMMARISLDSLKERFNEENIQQTFNDIDKEIINNKKFHDSFKGLDIDKKDLTITYSEEGKFGFAALLSDRPARTILLKRDFLE